MKKLLLLLILLAIPAAFAATYTDTTNSDFLNGTLTNVNVSANSLILNTSAGLYAGSGTFISRIFDLGSNPTANISWNFATPAGTSILLTTRSGPDLNTANMGWWSTPYGASTGSAVTSPQNRYYQYRAQLISTNNTLTPVLTDVTLTYTEGGTTISKLGTNLTMQTVGAYDFVALVNDTLQITNVTARYKIANGSYGNNTTLTLRAPATYNLTIPSPGWAAFKNTNLTVEVTASRTNGSVNDTVTSTLTELIDYVNTPPVIDPIANYTITQNQTLNVTITATDIDNNTLSFNSSVGTITKLTNNAAQFLWTPGTNVSGDYAVFILVNDSYTVVNRSFIVTVIDVNDAPTISAVPAISGYHGIRQAIILTAYDPDLNDTLTFSVSPALFRIETQMSVGNNTSSGNRFGVANFTPANPEDGVHNLTFTVTDGNVSVNTSAVMTIDYCGDGVCQAAYESADSCVKDCVAVVKLQSIALIVPDRNCANRSMTIRTFNATDRFSCYYEGLVEQGLALCNPLPSVSIAVYLRNGSMLTSQGSLSSDSDGNATFTPLQAGEYKFSANKDGFSNTSTVVYVRSCDQDIIVQEHNVTIEQPPLPPIETKPHGEKPVEETPSAPQEASLLQAMLFYVAVPLLLAMLLYAGSVFYDVNKDTLPWLLESRIYVFEKRRQYDPQISAAKQKVEPVVKPVVDSLNALYVFTLKPLVDKLRRK